MMATLSSHFVALDLLLSPSGARTFSSFKYNSIINYVFRVNWLFAYYCEIILFANFRIESAILYRMIYWLTNTGALLSSHLFVIKSNTIKEIYVQLVSQLAEKDKRRLFIFTYVFIIILTILLFPVATVFSLPIFNSNFTVVEEFAWLRDQPPSAAKTTMAAFVAIYFMPVFITMTFSTNIFIYSAIIYCYLRVNYNYYENLRKAVKGMNKNAEENCFRTEIKTRNQLDALFRQIEETMCFFPFIWFSMLFFTFAGMLWTRKHDLFALESDMLLILFSFVAISLCGLLVFIDKLRNYDLKESNLIAEQLLDVRKVDFYADQLAGILSHRKPLILTGWQFYNLNRGFMLYFAGGLLTFSVLFMQLTDNLTSTR